VVSSTSCAGSAMRGIGSATAVRRVSSGSGHVADETPVRGELCVDTDIPEDSIESLELDARLRIDSSEELDLSSSCLSRSSSLGHQTHAVNGNNTSSQAKLACMQDEFRLIPQ
jgi:hypothetical protein